METLYFPINFLINLKLLKKKKPQKTHSWLTKTINRPQNIKFKNVKKRH